MYTKNFSWHFILKFISDSGATILSFNKDSKLFTFTNRSKLKCKKVLLFNTAILLFFVIRTVEAQITNHALFPFCYLILLTQTLFCLGFVTCLFRPDESAYGCSQLYRFALGMSGRDKGINKSLKNEYLKEIL
jgi:hypothetical protein